MSWVVPRVLRQIIATLLLLLDLSQEPGSALSFLALADADDDAVSEICTEDSFWCGPSADRQNLCEAVRSKQTTSPAEAAVLPQTTPTLSGDRSGAAKAAITASTQHSSDLYISSDETFTLRAHSNDALPASRDLRDPLLMALMTTRLLI
jgi:hypothetical protein